jgi:DNA ligase-1
MTVIDALAISFGEDKTSRNPIERAYNISSDLGMVAGILVQKGLKELELLQVTIDHPIRPMLAERLASSEEILTKMGGRCMAEYKYDGERIQIHKDDQFVTLFSRRLEKISTQYPDVIDLVIKHVKANRVILEGECVAVTNEGALLPFQELMHRRRKYNIKKTIQKYPISLFLFDVLYLDGKDLTLASYFVRRKMLASIIDPTTDIQIVKSSLVTNTSQLETFFQKAIEFGCEGVICKSISESSIYQAGSRGWNWIKYKRDYKSELIDTIDLVLVGAYYGRGKRAGTYGAFLLATYDSETDTFETITKCGTGFSEKDLNKIPNMIKDYQISERHGRVKAIVEPDVWFTPNLVLEILGAEITLSPIHTCGIDSIRKGSGLAIRFPRFTGKYRKDKAPEDSTTSAEIISIYQNQLKQI